MSHDALVDSLEQVLEQLEAKDAIASNELVERLWLRFQETPDAAADSRVLPLYEACIVAATKLSASIEAEMRSLAQSTRASSAYGARP